MYTGGKGQKDIHFWIEVPNSPIAVTSIIAGNNVPLAIRVDIGAVARLRIRVWRMQNHVNIIAFLLFYRVGITRT